MRITIFFGLVLIIEEVFCGNILFVDNAPVPSHQMWNYNIAEELLTRGHNVTIVGSKTIEVIVHKNFTMLELGRLQETTDEVMNNPLIFQKLCSNGFFDNLHLYFDYCKYTCEDTLRSPNLKKLLEYPEDFRFDLLIFEASLGGCLYPLIQRFKYPPTIAVIPFLLPHYASEAMGNVVNPSYLPHLFGNFTNQMSFPERLANYFLSAYDTFMRAYVHEPIWNAQVRAYFGDDTEDIDLLEKHISILLANIMTGFHYAMPLTPNIIPVGGAHIKSINPLPTDLQDIIDNSKHGVIFFSLGTFVNTDDMDPSLILIILETLKKLKETIMWKTDSDIDNIPTNVVTRRWFPQNDILAHPNTKAFISHCGGHGTMEAAYHGIPVIGLPVFADQHYLCSLIATRKMGKVMDFSSITTDGFYDTIQEVLNNAMYKENAREISVIVKDQKESPLERAMFWIEWTMRHNNTRLIQPQSRYMSVFSSSCFDVYLFSLLTFAMFVLILRKLIIFMTSLTRNGFASLRLSKMKLS